MKSCCGEKDECRDPVCGMNVSSDSPHKCQHKGKEYCFCGEKCKEEFDKNPENYVGSK